MTEWQSLTLAYDLSGEVLKLNRLSVFSHNSTYHDARVILSRLSIFLQMEFVLCQDL